MRKGWLDEICSHMKNIIDFSKPGKYIIYVYEDEINHYAYVGLTNNALRRDREHMTKPLDRLYKHCIKFDIAFPEMKIIETDLSASQAAEAEKRIWQKYKNSGWNMINIKKCLGRLGGQSKIRLKATEEIKEILKQNS